MVAFPSATPAPFTETAGTFINCEGRIQGFNGVAHPLGETRPGWKVLRVLGNLLGIAGFDYETSEAVRDMALGGKGADLAGKLDNRIDWPVSAPAPTQGHDLQRIAEVPIYHADPIVRRAPSLQRTADARLATRVIISAETAAQLGLAAGDEARIRQGNGEALLPVAIDDKMAHGSARIPAALASTATLGPMSGRVTLERAT